ncbi:hypothetical protein NIES4071_106540 (plasmid) [Calothrix sp. NIES-4071]|nr:hypothetical protein NIES4071_106540 [Calothrix sp. NIES-4071]BAZ65072.1 hypothetical protein NIES4105_108050 [Calothrix sp. NIES-4105]
MSNFKKLLESAKNQPIDEAPSSPNGSTNDSVDNDSTNELKQAPVATKKVSPRKNAETGKSKNPDYRQTTIYVRKDLQRKLIRLLEDQEYKGDFSDWVEECMVSKIKRQKS